MAYQRLKFSIHICLCLAAIIQVSQQANEESVKQDVPSSGASAKIGIPIGPANKTKAIAPTKELDKNVTKMEKVTFYKSLVDDEIPESFKMGFYFFIGLSIAAILFILAKVYGMRLSRAERKYGVQGDRTTQELTPLPMAIEDDSENEDHTLFDINKQIRVS